MGVHSRPIGMVPQDRVSKAFAFILYTGVLSLVILSVVGTFYGLTGYAFIPDVTIIWFNLSTNPYSTAVAIAIQFVLTTLQWGSRVQAHNNSKFWALYLFALGISVWFNMTAYLVPLSEIMPMWGAALFIIAGDVIPEFIGVRRG